MPNWPSRTSPNATKNPKISGVIPPTIRPSAISSRRGLAARDFLRGSLGVAAIAATVSPLALMAADKARAEGTSQFAFKEIEAGSDENHRVADGYDADILIRWGDPVLSGAPAFDPLNQSAAGAAPAIRIQQRLSRLLPHAGCGQPVAPRSARCQSRIHQRGTDVPRPRPAGRQVRRSPK